MTVPEPEKPRPSVPAVWGDVPARNKNFTGREDILARLREGASSRVMAVLPEAGPGGPVADPDNPPQGVQGLGGVGKTAIAAEYAHRYRSEYDLVWWIPADQLPSARGSLAALAQRLRVDAQPMAGVDGLITAVLGALKRGEPYSRWLLVFDNADQPDEISRLIPRGPGDVLVTSRNHRWQSVISTVPMDVFSREESKEFLLRRVPRGLTEPSADELAKALGDLPLALEQAGAMLSETGMAVDEYLRLLKEHVTDLMAEGKSPDYPLSMTAAWTLSVDTLKRQRPQALELLRCFAFFGPEPIPRDVFRRGPQDTGTPVAAILGNQTQMSSAIRELARYALITLDGDAIRVHRLIQALLRDGLTPEQQAGYRREAHLILAAAAPTDPDDATAWPQFKELLPHVSADSVGLQRSREPAVRELVRLMMRYVYQSGDYASALSLTERFIEQWVKDGGPDDPDVMRGQRHLGNIQRLLGRYQESYALTEDALGRAQVILGEDDPATLSLRTSFAADLRAQGRFAEAWRFDEQSRPLHEDKYGSDDSRTLRLLSSLALDVGLICDYRSARKLYELTQQRMSRRSSASTALDLLGAWTGLAWSLRMLGEFDTALDVSEDALDFGRSPAGPGSEHLAILRAVNAYLIAARRIENRRAEAIDQGRTTLELATRRYGGSHPDTLAITICMTNMLRSTDESYHAEALDLAQSAVDRFPAAYGHEHPYFYGCLGNLALMKRITGDPAGARELSEQAVRGLTTGLGAEHQFTLAAAMNLAGDLAELGERERARRIGEESLPRLTALLGPDHWHTLSCANNLALDLRAAGDKEAGRQLREETLRRFRDNFSDDFPEVAVAAQGGRLDPDFDPPAI
jgi:tetratricopeptide (TPR) repeat protein